MSKPGTPNRKDAELVAAAKAYSKAFNDSAAAQTQPTGFAPSSGMSLVAAGVVEITDALLETMAALRSRAMKILGSKAGHERAMDQTFLKVAHQSVADGNDVDAMATVLINAVFDQALVTYEYVAPNRHALQRGDQGHPDRQRSRYADFGPANAASGLLSERQCDTDPWQRVQYGSRRRVNIDHVVRGLLGG